MRALALSSLLLLATACGQTATAGERGGQCLFPDAATQGTCGSGLQCLWLGSCDPGFGRPSECGQTCVDCSLTSSEKQSSACSEATDGGV